MPQHLANSRLICGRRPGCRTTRTALTRPGGSGPLNYYAGPRACTFTYTFGNFGPDALPVGATLSFGLPFAAIWNTNSFTITNSNGRVLTPMGEPRPQQIEDDPVLVRRWWDFTLGSEIPAATSFNVTFTVNMNGTNNTATNFYFVRTVADIDPGSSGATDIASDNNRDTSQNQAFFNRIDAGG